MKKCWILLLLCCFVRPSFAASATLPVSEDASVVEAIPTTNLGTSAQVRAEDLSGLHRAGYLKYDLSAISGLTSSNVLSAKLRVYVSTVDAAGDFDVYEVGGAWAESTITWNNAPGTTGAVLDTGTFGSGTLNTFVELDITSVVQGWANGNANNGVVLIAHSNSSGRVAAKENTSGWPASEIVVVTDQTGPPTITLSAPAYGSDMWTGLMGGRGYFLPHADNCGTGEAFVEMLPSGEGYCIETNERATQSWEEARNTCLTVGKRLPEAGEYKFACTRAGTLGLSSMTDNGEWVSNFPKSERWTGPNFDTINISVPVMGVGACDISSEYFVSATGTQSGGASATFRCLH